MYLRRLTALVLCGLLTSTACTVDNDPEPSNDRPVVQSSQHQLWLEREGDSGLSLQLSTPSERAPRVAEIWLRTRNVHELHTQAAGDATTQASKDLIVQSRPDGLYRIVIMSSNNVNTIQSGTLAHLEFERESDDAVIHAEILTDRPMFAPEESQRGLMVGDAIEF